MDLSKYIDMRMLKDYEYEYDESSGLLRIYRIVNDKLYTASFGLYDSDRLRKMTLLEQIPICTQEIQSQILRDMMIKRFMKGI